MKAIVKREVLAVSIVAGSLAVAAPASAGYWNLVNYQSEQIGQNGPQICMGVSGGHWTP